MVRRIGRRGVSALEFALVAPVLALLLFGTYDVANVVQTSIRLERAARAGAQYAAANAADMEAVRARVIAAWPELTAADVPLPTLTCECASAVVSCNESCGTAGPVRTVTITASRTLSPVLLQDMDRGQGSAVVRLR